MITAERQDYEIRWEAYRLTGGEKIKDAIELEERAAESHNVMIVHSPLFRIPNICYLDSETYPNYQGQPSYQIGYFSWFKPSRIATLAHLLGHVVLDHDRMDKDTLSKIDTCGEADIFVDAIVDYEKEMVYTASALETLTLFFTMIYTNLRFKSEIKKLLHQGFKPLLEKTSWNHIANYIEQNENKKNIN